MYVYTVETNQGVVCLSSSRHEACEAAMDILEGYCRSEADVPIVKALEGSLELPTDLSASIETLNRQILDYQKVRAEVPSLEDDQYIIIQRWTVVQRKREPKQSDAPVD